MAEYTVQTGQNLFDVALSLYGSIEGLLDLMVNNPTLSIDSEIKSGDRLQYTPYYYEDQTVLQYYKSNNIVPSNRIGDIYFKEHTNIRMQIYCSSDKKMIGISASGEGDIYVDWGDNAEIERITLSSSYKYYSHILTSDTTVDRRIRLFGDFKLYDLDLSDLYPNKILSFAPLHMETIKINGATKLSGIDFIQMVDPKGLIEIGFIKCRLNDLSPLIDLKNAHTINLGYCNIGSGVMDKYLIGLVENYGIRRNCTINLVGSTLPSGEYKKPDVLLHPKSGMEAIWVLVNEHKESSGPWKIILNNKTYTI